MIWDSSIRILWNGFIHSISYNTLGSIKLTFIQLGRINIIYQPYHEAFAYHLPPFYQVFHHIQNARPFRILGELVCNLFIGCINLYHSASCMSINTHNIRYYLRNLQFYIVLVIQHRKLLNEDILGHNRYNNCIFLAHI